MVDLAVNGGRGMWDEQRLNSARYFIVGQIMEFLDSLGWVLPCIPPRVVGQPNLITALVGGTAQRVVD